MRNDMAVSGPEAEGVDDAPVTDVPVPAPARPAPLLILAADEGAVCVDDLCLPPDVER